MLTLKNITKKYKVSELEVGALNDISINFRKSEFVSILGPSGCGKTTLLNIIGGLDRYTSGDLVIKSESTKNFADRDWDNYRNDSVGFVFQSYNLIPHQSVLQNVELALTLSGVGKKERRERAIEALTKVGLADKIKSRPNQLSGGQMQRVAIARALVNDPEIVLADEPTGALDTESSVQIMELLKEISKDKLIIMVTHNPELAEKYSTRIVRLLDGKITSDSKPYSIEEKIKDDAEFENKSEPKSRMSFFTALSLSFKNLLTKKARTILVSVAGSIGIIGIALILAISSGFSGYVNKIQQETLSSYPITLSSKSYDLASIMEIFFSQAGKETAHSADKVYTKNELTSMLQKTNQSSTSNDLKSFREYLLGDGKANIERCTTAVQYVYDVGMNAYYNSVDNGLVAVNPTTVFADKIAEYPTTHTLSSADQQIRYGLLNSMFGSKSTYYSNEFWSEMLDNQTFLQGQYELVGGSGSHWATGADEVMIVLDRNNQLTDYTLFGLGLLDQTILDQYLDDYINDAKEISPIEKTLEYSDVLGMEYKIIPESSYYEKQLDNTYLDVRTLKTTDFVLYQQKINDLCADPQKVVSVRVAGIVKPREGVSSASLTTPVVFPKALTNLMIEQIAGSEIVLAQIADQTKNVITGQSFDPASPLPIEVQYQNNLAKLGYVDFASPSSIKLYPIKFESKAEIEKFIAEYNKIQIQAGQQNKAISYTDMVGTMMSSISTIISAITYVLIAFVGVSLVVSSIMIGIITYISVIERTKEIGVLRSVGASKRDVKRVFTAESFIVGLASGLFGVLVAVLFTIPINLVLVHYTEISGMANLPILGAVILVLVSVILTFIAGRIPARIASKKDPVVALRSE